MQISEVGIERRTGTPMRTPPEKRQQCLTTRLATHRNPPKTTHSNTRIESTPSGALPPGGARDCVHICQQFRVRQDILCDIRTAPLRSIQPSVRVRLACPRRTVPHYRIPVYKSPSGSTRTSVFALYAQLSGLTGFLWTSPCIQVNCPCCQFIPAQLLFEDLPRY